MAFGMKTTTGDFLPIIKYDARAGKLFKVDRRMGGGSDVVELPCPQTTFAIDFGSIEAGYMMIGTMGPVRMMKPYIDGDTPVQQPPDRDKENKPLFRPGFYVKVAGQALDGLREFCGMSAALMNAMDDLHQKFLTSQEASRGEIPLINIASTTAIKSGAGPTSSTNYAPVFSITGWIPRPSLFGERTVPAPRGAAQAAVQQPAVQQPAVQQSAVQQPAQAAAQPAMAQAWEVNTQRAAEEAQKQMFAKQQSFVPGKVDGMPDF